ncbi:MAG TPA: hemerythrin domain-containing protein [Ktedonobacterales bacterium]
MDVLTQLSGEHEALRVHLERIESAAVARDDRGLLAALEAARPALTEELDTHIDLEEAEVFAPVGESIGEGLVAPFREEHVEVRALRDDIFAAIGRGETPYAASLRLCDLISDHQRREDGMLFPSARSSLGVLS